MGYGNSAAVFNGSSSAQSLGDMLAIIHNLPKPINLVVLELNERTLCRENGWARMTLEMAPAPLRLREIVGGTSERPIFDEFFREAGRLRNSALHLYMSLAHGQESSVNPANDRSAYLDSPEESLSVRKLNAVKTEISLLGKGAGKGNGISINRFRKLIQDYSGRLLVLLLPVDPIVRPALSSQTGCEDTQLNFFSNQEDVLDLRSNPLLMKSSLFRDNAHLSPKGRELVWPLIRSFLKAKSVKTEKNEVV